MLDITRDTFGHLLDEHTAASGSQKPIKPAENDHEVFDNVKYLEEMEIDRNWQIPREKLEILQEKLGTGEFGIVWRGFYLRRDGSKMPVAVKTLRGLCSIVIYAECITSGTAIADYRNKSVETYLFDRLSNENSIYIYIVQVLVEERRE